MSGNRKTWNKGRILTLIVVVLLLITRGVSHAQDRSRMAVYVPIPSGGTTDQQNYFLENFKMELIGANYPSVETREESMYTLLLSISDNQDFDPSLPVSDDNNRFYLGIKLERSADSNEIVAFEFPFNTTESMANWNLFLLYQALANAYVPSEPAPPADQSIRIVYVNRATGEAIPQLDDLWRNQTYYLNLALGLYSGHFVYAGNGRIDWGIFMPAAIAGFEWYLLNYLSLELDPIKPQFLYDGDNLIVGAACALLVKGVFKPIGVMLEPYGGAEYSLGIIGGDMPPLSALGGVQIGFRAGERSAWILDVGISISVIGAFRPITGDSYNVLRAHITGGWKLGFKERTARKEEEENKP
jgi:hypothetical protein